MVFITGAGTGAGKTFLACRWLEHLRACGTAALAVKPFCTGNLQDARLLRAAQDGALSLRQISPFFYRSPQAPLAAARLERKSVALAEVVAHIQDVRSQAECLLVEGCGGLLVPLGEGYCILDLIVALQCPAVLVAVNSLGTVNHTLLSWRALQAAGVRCPAVVLMDTPKRDVSAAANPGLIADSCRPTPVAALPFLRDIPVASASGNKSEKIFRKTLVQISRSAIVAGH